MGIFDALTTAVAGIQAQSYALQNISGNIANSQTTGYKRTDTSFEDLVADARPTKQIAGNVVANSRATNSVQGDIQTASTSTYMAINGNGYFVVEKPSSSSDGRPLFGGVDFYTRRGDFAMDSNGFLVNGAGYYLMGIPVDSATGNLSGSVPQVLQFQNDFLPAQATTQIQYRANLASYPLTQAHDKNVPGSELIIPADFTGGDPTVAGTGQVVGDDVATFIKESLSGGAITAFNASGAPVNVQLRWGKTDSATLGAGHSDTWNLFYEVDSDATATQVGWQNAGIDYTFVDGQMNPPVTNVTLTGVVVDGVTLGDINLIHGSGGLTQFADTNGDAQVNLLQQNGFPAGQLQSVAVNDNGRVIGSYSNGRTIDLAEVTLASFTGPDALKRFDGGAFAVTDESGPAILGAPGKIVGSSLEASNTDIADEFSKLIVTQQAYSANTKIITTGNQMLQDLLNMIR